MSRRPRATGPLGPLERFVARQGVREIFVSASGRTQLTTDEGLELADARLDEAGVVELAEAIATALGVDLETTGGLAMGAISAGVRASVAVEPASANGPVINVTVDPPMPVSIDAADRSHPEALQLLLRAVDARMSIVLAGPRGSGRTTIAGALAASWGARIALIGPKMRPTEAAPPDLLVLPQHSVDAAVALGADCLVVDDPTSEDWAALLLCGRPFVATIEAATMGGGLRRALAHVLYARAGMAFSGAEALVASSLDLVVELHEGRIAAVGEPQIWARELGLRTIARETDDGFELSVGGSGLAKRLGFDGGGDPRSGAVVQIRSESSVLQSPSLGSAVVARPPSLTEDERPEALAANTHADDEDTSFGAEADLSGDLSLELSGLVLAPDFEEDDPADELTMEAADDPLEPAAAASADDLPGAWDTIEQPVAHEADESVEAVQAAEDDPFAATNAQINVGALDFIDDSSPLGSATRDDIEVDERPSSHTPRPRRVSTLHEALMPPARPPARSVSLATDLLAAAELGRTAPERQATELGDELIPTAGPGDPIGPPLLTPQDVRAGPDEGTLGPKAKPALVRNFSAAEIAIAKADTRGFDLHGTVDPVEEPTIAPDVGGDALSRAHGVAPEPEDYSGDQSATAYGIEDVPELNTSMQPVLQPDRLDADDGEGFEASDLDDDLGDVDEFDEETPFSSLVDPDDEPQDLLPSGGDLANDMDLEDDELEEVDGDCKTMILPAGTTAGVLARPDDVEDDELSEAEILDRDLTVDAPLTGELDPLDVEDRDRRPRSRARRPRRRLTRNS